MNTSTSTTDPVGTPAAIAATPTPKKLTRDTGGKSATDFSSANSLVHMKGGFITPTLNRHKDKDTGKDIEESSTIEILDDGTEDGTDDSEDDDSIMIVEGDDAVERETATETIAEKDKYEHNSREDDTSMEDSSYAEEFKNNDNPEKTTEKETAICASGELCEDKTGEFCYTNRMRRCTICGGNMHEACASSSRDGFEYVCKKNKCIKEKKENDKEEKQQQELEENEELENQEKEIKEKEKEKEKENEKEK